LVLDNIYNQQNCRQLEKEQEEEKQQKKKETIIIKEMKMKQKKMRRDNNSRGILTYICEEVQLRRAEKRL